MGTPVKHPSLPEALRVWLKIGLLSFGGPAGQIAMMHREVVEKRHWVSDSRFLHALNYCMLLPGPEAQQLAVYIGWLLHRTRGGLIAGALFVVPGALFMFGISAVYVFFGKIPWIEAGFYGLKAAVLAVVFSAVTRIGKKVLKNQVMWGIAAASFIGIFFFKVPFPVIVAAALSLGFLGGRRFPAYFNTLGTHHGKQATATGNPLISDDVPEVIPTPTWSGTLLKITIWTVIWLAPIFLCIAWLGPHHILSQEGIFFSKAALVTFGGAYAVLPYVAQQAVEIHGWLSPTQMMDGLALAETTPGPLILVLQFVGFLGGWHAPGNLPPILMATFAALMTLWATFIPGFLFIFVGAPFIERTRGNLSFSTALSAVTAAVVGVILNLAVWFGEHTIIPKPGQFDFIPLILATAFLFLLQKKKWDILPIVALGALAGILLHFFGVR